jgi:hypothetical protein
MKRRDLTRDEFLEAYARRSKKSVEWILERGFLPIECNCDIDGCHGWALSHRNNPIVKLGHVTQEQYDTAVCYSDNRLELERLERLKQ